MSTAPVPGHLSLTVQLDMVAPLCDADTYGLCIDPQRSQSATAHGSSCSNAKAGSTRGVTGRLKFAIEAAH